jgi:RNA 3'-terminal phosphate cyclase (ATP)
VRGNELGSQELEFIPTAVSPGTYEVNIPTAGSTILVLQTVLPALLTAGAPSRFILEGGTHNPYAPPFEFLDQAFLPLINRMGPSVTAHLTRAGFYPAGRGRIEVELRPAEKLRSFCLEERGRLVDIFAEVLLANLPEHIGRRELAVIGTELELKPAQMRLRREATAVGPGNVVSVTVRTEQLTEVFVGFGKKGVPAETVARRTVKSVARYLRSEVAVGQHLADQLLVPLALAGGGLFTTLEPTRHTLTNMEIVQAFVGRPILCQKLSKGAWQIGLEA